MIGQYFYLVYGIIEKEQLILFPVALNALNDEQMDEMYTEAFDYGFTFLNKTPPAIKKSTSTTQLRDDLFESKTGHLTFKQITLIFNHLPVDITYVDKHDRVKFFNETNERHFPRSASIINRLVKHCHPPKSVAMVQRIVDAFKKGEKNHADFYIHFKDSYLYIQYFAVRDEDGDYEGVLEVSQNIKPLKAIEGEKRLLDWQ